ncbi:MAG: type II secretion system protein N [Phenylobacterium sp.]|nr:type II secretion system protein N [Phenylobacterium sp.]
MRPVSNLPLVLPALTLPALGALFSALTLILVLATAPLSLALSGRGPAAGLSATMVTGTVWRGRLTDAALGGVRLGDVRIGVSPLSLAAARVRLGFRSEAAQGAVRLGARSVELMDVQAVLPLTALSPGAGLSGQVRLRGFNLEIRGAKCQEAGGEVVFDQLSLGGLELAGLTLAGTPTCSGWDVMVPLRGQADGVDVQANLRVSPTGAYEMQLDLRTTRPEVEAALSAAGYQRTLNGYETRLSGRLGA